MAGIQAFNEVYPVNVSCFLTNAMGTTPQAFNSAIYTKFRLDAIVASSSDTVDRVLVLELYDGLFYYPLGSVNVPAGAGQGTVPVVDVIAALPTNVQKSVVQADSYFLQARVTVAVTAAKQLNVIGIGGSL